MEELEMQHIVKPVYPNTEIYKLQELDNLFNEWYAATENTHLPAGYSADDLVFDGFFPYYTSQKVKVLFLGRESRGISGCRYIDVLYNAYKNQKIGGQHINANFFHKRMFYITYGLNNDFPKWKDIPPADDLSRNFGSSNGISFAFMNISKFSNENENTWNSNWELINTSYNLSKSSCSNFILKEIEILDPDIVITMNLREKLNILGEIKEIEKTNKINTYIFNTKIKTNILLLDTFHFSAPRKDDVEDYYTPIGDAIRKHYTTFK